MNTQTATKSRKLTPEQKEANKLARREARKAEKEAARIEAEKNQKEVAEITINIEWVKSRMWGYNPRCEATVKHKDGTYSYGTATASGCGYDKESTVIAEIFNNFLKYKLYRELIPVEDSREEGRPYGIYISQYRHYSGGIGTNCYYSIAKAIGGKFEKTASGKSFDCYKYTDFQ